MRTAPLSPVHDAMPDAALFRALPDADERERALIHDTLMRRYGALVH